MVGCAAWPVVAAFLIEPMIALILGPCFWEAGCGATDGLGAMGAIVAAMLAAIPVCMAVRALINIVLERFVNLGG